MALLPFRIKISRKLRRLLLFLNCTYLNILHIRTHLQCESCKVTMLLELNLETEFYKQCMLHHDAKCGRETVGKATCAVKRPRNTKRRGNKKETILLFRFSGLIRDRCKGCDFISSFHGPRCLVPLLRVAPFLRWKDELLFSFISLRWSREAGRTSGLDWQEWKVSWSRCQCDRSSAHPMLTASSLWLMVAALSGHPQPLLDAHKTAFSEFAWSPLLFISLERIQNGSGDTGWFSLTSLVRLQLSLQVLGGHVKFLVLALSGPWFTFSTAAVTAATQAATEVAASGQAAEYKQSLQASRFKCQCVRKKVRKIQAEKHKIITRQIVIGPSVDAVLPLPTSLKGQSKCWHSLLQTAQPHIVPENHICHKYYALWGHSELHGRCLSPWTYLLPLDCPDSCQGGTSMPVSCVGKKKGNKTKVTAAHISVVSYVR